MKVLVNAVSAKLGGAATYIQNLARSLEQQGSAQDSFIFVLPPARAAQVPVSQRVSVKVADAASGSYAGRWWWEQVTLRQILRDERPDVLFSSANFAMLRCPCPQVLLVRNPIYFSREYIQRVLPQRGVALRAETALRRWLVCRSVASADCLMTPSAAMLHDLSRYAHINGKRAVVNHYGVPRDRVARLALRNGAGAAGATLRLLWVSHYADHKDLGTLLRAAAELRRAQHRFELVLTIDPAAQSGQHTALPAEEKRLLAALGDTVRAVGVQSYEGTWQLYSEADIFVFPSLVESFGHPLVEAMAAGLPIVASGVAIHREICGHAAEYYPVGDAPALAAVLQRLMRDAAARTALAERGVLQVQKFFWEDHVTRLLAVLRETAEE